VQVFGDDPDRGSVDVGELGPRLDGVHARLLRGIHRVVNLALRGGEGAVDGERAGDVGGEERVDLDPGVEQDHVACAHLAGVLDPVQGVGVIACGANGVVASAIALVARVEAKESLDPAFAAAALDGAPQVGDDRFEAHLGGVDRGAHLVDFPLVLDHPQVGEEGGERLVVGERLVLGRAAHTGLSAHLVDGRGDIAVGVADDPHHGDADVLGEGVW
jgi:hypothetical protein